WSPLPAILIDAEGAAAPPAMQSGLALDRRGRCGRTIVLLSVAGTRNGPVELSKKVKTALDETRMLILGAQILLGFEFRAAFSDGFDKLPEHSRHSEALALMLMVTSVALMIAPGPYHRLVEGGR